VEEQDEKGLLSSIDFSWNEDCWMIDDESLFDASNIFGPLFVFHL